MMPIPHMLNRRCDRAAVAAGTVAGLRFPAGGAVEQNLATLVGATGQDSRQGPALVPAEPVAVVGVKPVLVVFNNRGDVHQAALPGSTRDSRAARRLMRRAASCCAGSVSWV